MNQQQAPIQIVHVTRLRDQKPLAIAQSDIWYGRPVESHLYSAALLRTKAQEGDVPYHRAHGHRFAHEIRIESKLNEKANRKAEGGVR